MDIYEIRAEIPNAFGTCISDTDMWINENGNPDFDGATHTAEESRRTAARMLVDRAYEAGKVEGRESGVLFDAAQKVGFDKAARDPETWYVMDKNGEQVHIGDTVLLTNNELVTVQDLGPRRIIAVPQGSGWIQFGTDYFEKVIPDSRSRIVADLAAEFLAISAGDMFDDADKLAEQFISRIEALERNDA